MTAASLLPPLLLLLGACGGDPIHEGVLVGNPGEVVVKTASATGLTFRSGEVDVDTIHLLGCDGEDDTLIAEGVTVDLLGGSRLGVPEGVWCGLSVALAGPLTWTADLDGVSDETAEISLAPEALELRTVEDGFAVADAALELRLGGEDWLSADDLDAGEDYILDEQAAAYDTVLGALAETTALVDADSALPVAMSDPEQLAQLGDTGWQEGGRGCGSQEEVYTEEALLLLPLTALLGWRRRELSGRSGRGR